jgi:hypothetical protein
MIDGLLLLHIVKFETLNQFLGFYSHRKDSINVFDGLATLRKNKRGAVLAMTLKNL